MSESEWARILGWPGFRVYRSEINEEAKTLRLWVRRKRGNRKLECSGCGRRTSQIAEIYEREVQDLPWSEIPHDGSDRVVSSALFGLRHQGRESSAAAEQGALQQAL